MNTPPAVRTLMVLTTALVMLAACAAPRGTSPVPGLRTGTPVLQPAESSLPAPRAPAGLGTDDTLDALAVDCHRGVLQACDDLVRDSEPRSAYEEYGATCAGRNEPVGSCIRRYGESDVDTSPR